MLLFFISFPYIDKFYRGGCLPNTLCFGGRDVVFSFFKIRSQKIF